MTDMSAISGLTEAEAAARLLREGHNEIPSGRRQSIFFMAFEIVREPMFLLLVACGLIYLVLGDIREAVMLLGFVIVVMIITFYQEQRSERALEALRDISSPRALVIREGRQRRIAGRDVVRGDILVLAEGDRVPADSSLISCLNLSVDESILTGESTPANKTECSGEPVMQRPGGSATPFVYSGTLVAHGQGVALVRAIGQDTEIGRIGKSLRSLEQEKTPLQEETARLVQRLAIVGLAICLLIVIIFGIIRGDWLNGFLAGITLAMAILPEEFPVVLTIFLALGAWRISKKQVLTRRVPAIETLGACTVLCADKTGTLTFNSMSVRKIFAGRSFYDIEGVHAGRTFPEEFHELIEFGILASKKDPFDPMEKALRQSGIQTLLNTEHLHDDWTLVHEYPLSRKLPALSHVWKSPDGMNFVIACKGAPEALADLCHFDEQQNYELADRIDSLAGDGLRVIAVAKAEFFPSALPGEQHDFAFTFLGLIGLADPVRPNVRNAIAECYSAGMRVIMITGDYPATAQNIGRQIGLFSCDAVITGHELDAMDDAALKDRISEVNIFARVVPEQKLRIVNALKEKGEVVAMTGDGVNDAPALKAAHIGIAMGGRGSDVAREASSLVLLDDDFSAIVHAVRMGRRIFDNIRKAMAYIFAVHVPIIGLSLFPVLLGWPLILLPVHIVFLELIIDPACSIVFEAECEEEGIMRRRPRDPKDPLFSLKTIGLSLLQGIIVLASVLAVFAVAMKRGQGEQYARTLTVTTLVIANIGLIFANRSWSRTIISTVGSPNPALWWVTAGAAFALVSILFAPFLLNLFHFSALYTEDLFLCLAAGLLSVVWFEVLKVLSGRSRENSY
jgi:Ca2+-transporting ATPase